MSHLVEEAITMRKSQKMAILAALVMGVNVNSHVSASDTDYVYFNDQKFIEFEFFNEGEFGSEYTLSDLLREGTKSATSYWSGILAPRSNSLPPGRFLLKRRKIFKMPGR